MEKDPVISKQDATGCKILIGKILPKLFDLKSLWNPVYVQSNQQQMYLSIFPNGGQIELAIRKTGTIIQDKDNKIEGIEKSDLAWLLKYFGLDYNKFNIPYAIDTFTEHRDVLTEYLEQQETLAKTELEQFKNEPEEADEPEEAEGYDEEDYDEDDYDEDDYDEDEPEEPSADEIMQRLDISVEEWNGYSEKQKISAIHRYYRLK